MADETPKPPRALEGLVFRVLVIADLVPESETSLPPRDVDRHSLEELLAELQPRLALRTADHTGCGADELSFELTFRSLKDFMPDGLVATAPRLASLVQARQLLVACRAHEIEPDRLVEQLIANLCDDELAASLRSALADREAHTQAAATKAQPERDDPLDALLAKVELPASSGREAPSDRSLADLLATATVTSEASDRSYLEPLIAELDRRLTRQVAAIREEPTFRRLEEAWYGLHFLLSRADHRAGVRIQVLPAAREETLDVFFEQVFHNEYEARSEAPLSMVVLDHQFDRSPDHLETLRTAARMGESLQVPFVASVSPAFWGLQQAQLLANLPDLSTRFAGAEYAKWNAMRAEQASQWLCMTHNRLLARQPLSDLDERVRSFSWSAQASAADRPLWLSAAMATAAAACQGFATAGIRFPLSGDRAPMRLEDLPLRLVRLGSREIHSPLEVQLDRQQATDLARIGVAVLVASHDSDAAHLPWVPVIYAAERFRDSEKTRASLLAATLSYQLLAGTVAHQLQRIAQRTGTDAGTDHLIAAVRDHLRAVLALGGGGHEPDEVKIEVTPDTDTPGVFELVARLRPPFTVEGGEVDLVVGTTIE